MPHHKPRSAYEMTIEPEYLTTKQAATKVNLSRYALEKYRCSGSGPPFVRFGGHVRYQLHELLAWAQSRTCKNTIQSKAMRAAEIKTNLATKAARQPVA
jgi:predicted DNA-binding transcriptional regulator AlpA